MVPPTYGSRAAVCNPSRAAGGWIRVRVVAWVLIAGLVLGAWWSRTAVLTHLGAALISEDAAEAVDVVVISNACTRTCVLDAAAAWHEGRAGRFLLARWVPMPGDAEIRALGVALPDAADIARGVLEKSGVPPERIEVLEDGVDGTNREIVAVAGWATGARPASVLFMTARTHTARAAWLLHRSMPTGTRILVRSPRADRFGAADWWHDRNQTRDVAFEYVRWLNTFLLGDAWSTASGSP